MEKRFAGINESPYVTGCTKISAFSQSAALATRDGRVLCSEDGFAVDSVLEASNGSSAGRDMREDAALASSCATQVLRSSSRSENRQRNNLDSAVK
jgi:hypothetical protein